MAYTRCKLALTEDWPTINPYNQTAWANLADGNALPIRQLAGNGHGDSGALDETAGVAQRS